MLDIVKAEKVTEPGLYDMEAEHYHADPCPSASLSRSIGVKLLHKTPLHAWLAHPRLNPAFEEEQSNQFDLGSTAHSLVMGKGRSIAVLNFDDFRKAAAKNARDEAREAGFTAILQKDFDRADAMRNAAFDQLQRVEGCETAFVEGHAETVIAWKDKNGRWIRTMIDWLQAPEGRRIVVYDYKTTGQDANPAGLGRHLLNLNYDMQFGFIERAIRMRLGMELEVDFRLVVQETDPPYMLTVCDFDKEAQCLGQKKTAAAIALWDRCLTNNRWPGYPTQICTLFTPAYIATPWFEREERDGADFLFREDPLIGRPLPPRDTGMTDLGG